VEDGPGDLEAACALLGFPDGCPTMNEFTDVPDGFQRGETYAHCSADDGREWQVRYSKHDTGEPYGALNFLYFPLPGAGNRRLEALSLLPVEHGELWCCNRTTVTQRWIGKPLTFDHCTSDVNQTDD
jgi:hypothetical protein